MIAASEQYLEMKALICVSVPGRPQEAWTLMLAGLEREEEASCRCLEKDDPERPGEASSKSLERRVLCLGKEAADPARGRET